MTKYIEDQIFDSISTLEMGEYESCTFENCDFSEKNFSGMKFTNCIFLDSNLSMILLEKTGFWDVIFKGCKMVGLQFDTCNEFGLSFSFESCQLNYSNFLNTKIKGTIFTDCRLHEVDFSGSDLTGAIFDDCDLNRAIFEQSLLENVDFRKANNYAFDPELNRIRGAKFNTMGALSLLSKYRIVINP